MVICIGAVYKKKRAVIPKLPAQDLKDLRQNHPHNLPNQQQRKKVMRMRTMKVRKWFEIDTPAH